LLPELLHVVVSPPSAMRICVWLCALQLRFANAGHSGLDYDMGTAQQDWGGTCESGKKQSPIDIVSTKVTAMSPTSNASIMLKTGRVPDYKEATGLTLKMINPGHLQLNSAKAGDMGGLKIKGSVYDVLHLDMHFASEHTFDGKHALGEIQIVHALSGGKRAAVSIMILNRTATESEGKNFWTKLELHEDCLTCNTVLGGGLVSGTTSCARLLTCTQSSNKPITGLPLDLNSAFEEQWKANFFEYEGSRTTPGCNEDVNWHIVEGGIGMPNSFHKAMAADKVGSHQASGANRFIQGLNDRSIRKSMFGESDYSGASSTGLGLATLSMLVLAHLPH